MMTKAKTIDRLEWTRKHSPLLETRDKEKQQEKAQHSELPILTPEDFAFGIQREEDRLYNGDICPKCGKHTLIHSEGCEHCNYCGYDACAWREV